MSNHKIKLTREQRIEIMLSMALQNDALILEALGSGANSDAALLSLTHRAEWLRARGFKIPENAGGNHES